jgi:uncharacterized protein (TIGR03435 family)
MVLGLAGSVGYGQAPAKKPLAFEVVSVKASSPDAEAMSAGRTPDGFRYVNMPFWGILDDAYRLEDVSADHNRVIGLPGWAKDTRYDLQAKVAPEDGVAFKVMTDDEKAAMLRAVLEDRFGLKAHREARQMPVYALLVAKGGPKLKVADPADTYPNGIQTKDYRSGAGIYSMRMGGKTAEATFQGCGIDRLVPTLTGESGRTVVDKTGLTGKYDFKFEWTQSWVKDDDPEATAPRLFTALQEQLGLKLVPDQGPVDSVVVDHVEKPTEN